MPTKRPRMVRRGAYMYSPEGVARTRAKIRRFKKFMKDNW